MYGFIITTHYNNYDLIFKSLTLLIKHIPNDSYIIVYINETKCDKVLNLSTEFKSTEFKSTEFKSTEFIYIDDQVKNNGLTGTWNAGILKCIKKKCDVISILGHDTFVNESIKLLLNKVKDSQINNKLEYFAPLYFNYKNKTDELWQDSIHYKKHNCKFLIGSFLSFPINSLIKMKEKYDFYFDELKYPFGYNDIDFYEKFINIGGKGIIINECILDHEYKRSWVDMKNINWIEYMRQHGLNI